MTAELNGTQGNPQPAAQENAPGAEADHAARNTAIASAPDHRLAAKPRSLYPASIIGLAMISRGEIGFLVASIADSNGVFGQSSTGHQDGRSSGEIFLVVIWAITLCTLVGPISVGALVKRARKLQRQRGSSGGADPLGLWGLS
jgi:hypothetical protein